MRYNSLTLGGTSFVSRSKYACHNFDFVQSQTASTLIYTDRNQTYATYSSIAVCGGKSNWTGSDLDSSSTRREVLSGLLPWMVLSGQNEAGLYIAAIPVAINALDATHSRYDVSGNILDINPTALARKPLCFMPRFLLDECGTVAECKERIASSKWTTHRLQDPFGLLEAGLEFHYHIADQFGHSTIVEFAGSEAKYTDDTAATNYHLFDPAYSNPQTHWPNGLERYNMTKTWTNFCSTPEECLELLYSTRLGQLYSTAQTYSGLGTLLGDTHVYSDGYIPATSNFNSVKARQNIEAYRQIGLEATSSANDYTLGAGQTLFSIVYDLKNPMNPLVVASEDFTKTLAISIKDGATIINASSIGLKRKIGSIVGCFGSGNVVPVTARIINSLADNKSTINFSLKDRYNHFFSSHFDAATHCNKAWRTPSKSEFAELLANTTHSQVVYMGVECTVFTGTNGKSVLFPHFAAKEITPDTYAYATRTPNTSSSYNVYALKVDYGAAPQIASVPRIAGLQIRPVSDSDNSFIDLDLPSGTRWGSSNLDASTLALSQLGFPGSYHAFACIDAIYGQTEYTAKFCEPSLFLTYHDPFLQQYTGQDKFPGFKHAIYAMSGSDQAYNLTGGTFYTPQYEDYAELIANTTRTPAYSNTVQVYSANSIQLSIPNIAPTANTIPAPFNGSGLAKLPLWNKPTHQSTYLMTQQANLNISQQAPSIEYATSTYGYEIRPITVDATLSAVDLGLPSGIHWARTNIGADSETGHGTTFQSASDIQPRNCAPAGSGATVSWASKNSQDRQGVQAYLSTHILSDLESY